MKSRQLFRFSLLGFIGLAAVSSLVQGIKSNREFEEFKKTNHCKFVESVYENSNSLEHMKKYLCEDGKYYLR